MLRASDPPTGPRTPATRRAAGRRLLLAAAFALTAATAGAQAPLALDPSCTATVLVTSSPSSVRPWITITTRSPAGTLRATS